MDEPHYRSAYEADPANQAHQSWKEYWGWVRRFYEGQTFPPVAGWRKREEDLARAHAARHDVVHALREVGRMLAAEWAKDNRVRKVSTSDLHAWGKRFADVGKDGDAMLAAVRGVRDELERRGVRS